ncbi:MAG: CHAT domain-containing protein [Balneolaceae bacterium]|nr:CHAT domain-containing protein [Balneolaceae bacterium]
MIPRAKASTSVESGFWNIEPEYLEAFDVMVDLLIKTNRNEEAIETLDKLKTINDPALYRNPMVKSSLLNEAELTQYQRLTNELDALRRQQLVASDERKPIIKRRIDRLNIQKQALDQKISKLTTNQSVSLNDIQHRLSGSEVVLHITELNDWYYIGKVTKRSTEINKVRLDSTNRSLFKDAITNLSNGNTNLNQLYKISNLLELGELPKWITTITIVPDSYLFELPIDILPLERPAEEYSYGEATYFVERFNTHYVTSINDFIADTKSNADYAFGFAGYGLSTFDDNKNKNLVPLPFAKSEVNNIAANLSSLKNRKAFIDEESSESAFKASAPHARILHLATHSEISEQDPLYSTLYMSSKSDSSDTDFPGQIFAYELFELNLNNEMIMLNSCESGSGSYLQGTGIMGISRALRYAGAKSLVLNLWSVNDMMASEFAIKFYDYLNQGKSKTEALQLTKVHFIKEKNANPHFWGPYMLIGDKSPIIEPYEKANFYFAASFMLYFVLFVAFSLFKRQSQLK